jgi:hypothetical protein
MKKTKIKPIAFFFFALLPLVFNACSSRRQDPILTENNTKVYPAKDSNGISAQITLYKKIGKTTGRKIGVGNEFTIRDRANVFAEINIKTHQKQNRNGAMFHLEWLDASEKSIYRKQILLSKNDTSKLIQSSISVSPDKRLPGQYSLRLYYFRELIAEKDFTLKTDSSIFLSEDKKLRADICLYRKTNKKMGKKIGEGNTFTIGKKGKVRAEIELKNRFAYEDRDLVFRLKWIGPDAKAFYRKKIKLYCDDSTSVLKSAISITPEKRHPGNYSLQVVLFGEIIAEKGFTLKSR